MKIASIIILCGLLTACSYSPKEDKNKSSETSKNTKEIIKEKTETFQNVELTYPGSDISFKVNIKKNNLLIQPSGLSISNETFQHDITGYTVTKAEIGDLDIDGYPEVFVYLNSKGSGSYGKLIGYSVNNGKSVSLVHLPEIIENKKISQGYMGHDQMGIVENIFYISFPIYKENDNNTNPTGGTRKIQYELTRGESCKVLKIDKVFEF